MCSPVITSLRIIVLLLVIVRGQKVSYSTNTLHYLEQFNYLPKQTGVSAMLSSEVVEEALKKLQRYGKIPVTGKLDSATIKLMERKRCGLGDQQQETHKHRRHKKRFAGNGSIWHKRTITYSVSNSARTVRDIDSVRREVAAAFLEWQQVSPLDFLEVSPYADADIKISFASGDHQDGYPFDGTGRVLAHAFAPGSGTGGDVHLDDDEMWTVQLFGDPLTNLISLRSIILHELGHSLGLAHSYDEHSIMYAFYQHSLPPELTATDVRSIQSLYGARRDYYEKYRNFKAPSTTTPPTTTTTLPPPTVSVTKLSVPKFPKFTRHWHSGRIPYRHNTPPPFNPDICSSSIDAVTEIRGEFFVFKEKWLWRFRRNGELRSGPSLITLYWPELPEKVDGAVEDGKHIMFFTGNKCYIYNAHHLLSVRTLTDFGLPANINKIRLVYTWNYWPDEPIYIWAEDGVYWKYDRKSKKVELGYPRNINTVWHNVREDVSAAATLNNELFFFSPSKAAKFSSVNMTASEPFPVSQLWHNCRQPLRLSSDVQRSQYCLSNIIFYFIVIIYLH